MINAVVLAGGDKSLMPIHGKPMAAYVIDALRQSEWINRISIVGAVEDLKSMLESKPDYYYQQSDSLFDNTRIGLSPFREDPKVLIITSDIPMIRGEAIDDFIKQSMETGVDLCYPVVNRRLNDERFPEVRRTYVKLKEGSFTGGNAFLVNPSIIDSCEDFARKMIEYRKKPWKMGKVLGGRFLLMLLSGQLSIPCIESRFSEILGIKARAILSNYPEIGNDVDKPADLEMVHHYLKGEMKASS